MTFGEKKELEKTLEKNRINCHNPIKAKRIEEEAKLPTRKFPTDAGMDVYALEEIIIPPHTMQVVRTGVTLDFPDGTVALIWPKSRNEYLVGAGVVDCGYQGEILVKVTNISRGEIKIEILLLILSVFAISRLVYLIILLFYSPYAS